MRAHTPGPWLAARFGNGWFVYPRDGGRNVGDLTPVISEPDARLIAAAPDLLAALQEVSKLQGSAHAPAGSLWSRVNAAIAKATGVLGEPDARQLEIARARALYDKCDKP